MKNQENALTNSQPSILVSVWRGILVGLVSGGVVSLFRWSIGRLTDIVMAIYSRSHQQPMFVIGIVVVSLIVAVIVGQLVKSEPDIKGSGIPHIEGELMGLIETNWWSILWKKFIGGCLGISSGLMLGREGPSIQLGAMAAKGVGQWLPMSPKEKRAVIASGAAAGLSAAFNAPIAGLLFVVEEVYHHFSSLVWVSALVASLVANAVSLLVFGLQPVLDLPEVPSLNLGQYIWLIGLGIFLGLLGFAYEWLTLRMGKIYDVIGKWLHLPSYYYDVIAFLLIIPIGYYIPFLSGGGHGIIIRLATSDWPIATVFTFFVIRFVWSMISYGSGLPGGIFLPLLALGSVSGLFFGDLLAILGIISKEQTSIFIILGMAGYFGAVSKAPLTAIILVTEMVGDLRQLMTTGIVVMSAYLIMDLLGGEPIYEAMLSRLAPVSRRSTSEPTMIELPVSDSCAGKAVRDLVLPKDVLITHQAFQGKTSIVTGSTVLQAGATLHVVLNESDIYQVRQALQ